MDNTRAIWCLECVYIELTTVILWFWRYRFIIEYTDNFICNIVKIGERSYCYKYDYAKNRLLFNCIKRIECSF